MTARLIQLSGAVVDIVYRIVRVPLPGEDILAEGMMITAGGGFNAAAAARRGGMEVVYAGGLGTGPFATILGTALAAEGIVAVQPPQPARDQGSCVVLVDAAGERTFVSREGAEGVQSTMALAPVTVRDRDWVLLSAYTLVYLTSRTAVHAWVRALPDSVTFVFDPTAVVGQVPPDILADIVARADWISGNIAEIGMLTDGGGGMALLRGPASRARGVLVRRGPAGSTLVLRDTAPIALPGYRVAAVDTNGAGDTYIGSFIAAAAAGAPPEEAAHRANAAAALSTLRPGPATAPTDAEIRSFLAEAPQARTGPPSDARRPTQSNDATSA